MLSKRVYHEVIVYVAFVLKTVTRYTRGKCTFDTELCHKHTCNVYINHVYVL
jgi:hypothetical protein